MEKGVIQSDVWTRRLASGWIYWPACLLGVFLIALAVLGPEAERRLGVKGQCDAMQTEIDALARARDQLKAAEHALEHDPLYTERVVRHELGITRPGETRLPQPVGLLPAPKPETAAPAKPTAPLVADWPPPLTVDTAMVALANYGNSWLRFVTLVTGVTLLSIGVLFSLPGLRRVQA